MKKNFKKWKIHLELKKERKKEMPKPKSTACVLVGKCKWSTEK